MLPVALRRVHDRLWAGADDADGTRRVVAGVRVVV